ncbi:MAG: T9SS type A sorting domain-containing protein [Bacteroidetes bacterium]|nr:T9SS type A sorting domain-containing protein [Bacteroidota bacterium]
MKKFITILLFLVLNSLSLVAQQQNKTFEVVATRIIPHYISGNLANIRTSFRTSSTTKDTALVKFNDTLKVRDSLFVERYDSLARARAGIFVHPLHNSVDSNLVSKISFISETKSSDFPKIVPEVKNALKLVYTIKNKSNAAAKLYWLMETGIHYQRSSPKITYGEYGFGLTPQTGYGTAFAVERTQISHGDTIKGGLFINRDSSSQTIPANGNVDITLYYFNDIRSKDTSGNYGHTEILGDIVALFSDRKIDSIHIKPPVMNEVNVYPRFLSFGPGPFEPNYTRIDSFIVKGRNVLHNIDLSVGANSAFKFKLHGAQQFGNSFILNKDTLNKHVRMRFEIQFTAGNQNNYFDSLKVKIDSLRTEYVHLHAGQFGKDTLRKIFINKNHMYFGPIEPNITKVDSFRIFAQGLVDSVFIGVRPNSSFKIKVKGQSQFTGFIRLPKDANNKLKDTTIIVQFTPTQNQFEFDTLKIRTANSPDEFVFLSAGRPGNFDPKGFLKFNVKNLKAFPNCGDTMFTGQQACGAATYYAFTKVGWDVDSSKSICVAESLNVLTSPQNVSIKIDSLQLYGYHKVNTEDYNLPPNTGNLGDERIYLNGIVDIMEGLSLKLRLRNVILMNDVRYPTPIGSGDPCVGTIKAEAFGIIDTTVGDQTWINEISSVGSRVIGMGIENFSPVGVNTADCPNGFGFYNGIVSLYRMPGSIFGYRTISLPTQGSAINYTSTITFNDLSAEFNFTRAMFGRDSLPVNTNSGRRVAVAVSRSFNENNIINTPKNIKYSPEAPWFHIATTMKDYVASATFDFTNLSSQIPVNRIVFLHERGDSLLPIRYQTYLGNNKIRIDSISGWRDLTIGIRESNAILQLNTRNINFGQVKQHLTKDTTFVITNLSTTDTLVIMNMMATPAVFSAKSYLRKIPPSGTRIDTIRFTPATLGSVVGGLGIVSNTAKGVDTILLSANVITSVPVGTNIPTVFSLEQNYPNPFNPQTTIKYGLPKESFVKIEIFNMLGQKVDELLNEVQSAHYYEVVWDGKNLSSGMYLYKIEATDVSDQKNKFTSIKKMILMK